ncbi:WD40/YVTN/BNR-like repeat-containing protein [Cecembia lonarensis]|uniref:Plant photosystem II stability/assembly factor-like protein n=1 Tax=Cecembia lonarensis (strain CCUG 58316 / KCTC 22772 / LW9) TaxID=1225176 RepID=K1LC75_CECL9|nr:glycosyl hydrolase [Cecembia lonarensis]EKB49797.1 plant photosystem II stability/assembly factor-like protein [Cecembia lonarensis LW9]
MKKALSIFLILIGFQVMAQDLYEASNPMKYRNIGPFRGGRSVAVSGVLGDPLTYYMGKTGGGVWKTSDAGQCWENISDGFFTTGSVGAIAVSESHPRIVFVGMGEHAPRGVMTSYGDGVYKSTDAGKTWRKMGLEKTQHISRIIIHPDNPDIVYVAAQGALHGPNEERGIYKSTDGGETWERVLFVNTLTGASELSMDMNFPDVLYAAMWEHQRLPWKVISGGDGSGLYKSTDGGETWQKLENGLPKEMGKMAIAVSRANSEKVYALIESDSDKGMGGLFVSENGGNSWSKVSGDNRLVQRAWYYIEVFPDPNAENTVYVLSAPALRSIDGGKTWEVLPYAHGDYHDMWINPKNSKNLVIADDGGAAISFDFAQNWSRQDNMPTAQMYRINTDNQFPYRIYGGQQDNTSLVINSLALGRGGITQEHWNYSAGGESAFLAFDPDNPRYVLGGSYLGTIEVLDSKSQASTNIMIAPIQYLGRDASDMRYRFNWNAPIIWSQHEPGTFYHAAQYVLRTRDMGNSWEVVSPDLSRDEKEKQGKGGGPYTNEAVGAENYGTIAYLIESPHEKGVLWAGSDDGLVHLTRDGGATWANVTPKGMPETLVNAIEVSPHDPATAYIATTRYKFNDYTPAIYKTKDYGRTWTNISKGIPYGAFTRVVREDNEVKGLLYAGTETGLYLSRNEGESWESFQLNMPITPITDLKIAHNDLVVATAGRSYWILDDLNVVREMKTKVDKPHVYNPDDAIIGHWYSAMNGSNPTGTDLFEGVNPANGVVIYYHLPDNMEEGLELSLEIKDAQGNVVRSFSSKANQEFISYDGGPSPEPVLSLRKGLNRFVWDMRYPTMPGIPTAFIEGSYRGHKVVPGTYTLHLKSSLGESEAKAKVLENPLFEISIEQYQVYHEFMQVMETELIQMHNMVNALMDYQNQLKAFLDRIQSDNSRKPLYEEGQKLLLAMQSWDEDMVQRKSKAYDDVENFPNKFTANYLFLINQTESQIPRVNQGSRKRFAELSQQWAVLKTEGNRLMNTAIPAYNRVLQEAGIGLLFVK